MSSSSNRQKPAMAQHARAADPGKRKRSLGVTLIEAIAAIGVMSAATVGLVALVDNAMDNTRAHATAQHMSTVGQAAQLYIRDHFAAVAANAGPGPAALRIDISTLIGAGHLPPGFSSTNPKGQTLCVAVIEPVANQLHAVVLAQGGQAIDDVTLGQIAGSVGGSGGAVYAATPTVMRGTMGGWERAVGAFTGACAPQVSRPVKALWFTDGAANAGLIRDAVPGNPAMNTMNTPILMGGGTVVVANNPCLTPGAVAREADGTQLICEGGRWHQGYMQDPVANFAALPACDASTRGHTRAVLAPSVGTGARAYTCNAAGQWQALAVDDLGNMAIPGTATINRLGGALELTTVVTPGTTCGTNGQIARSADGLLLSCQDGNWLTPVRMPRMHRFLFTSSTTWRVPEGVLSAFVTMSGGGGSGAGWRISNALITGHSGGFVFSHPINLVPGETLEIVVGYGGWGANPVHIPGAPHPFGHFVPNPHDNGLGGHPGGRSAIISPSGGILLECAGGSGATLGNMDTLNGGEWIPGPQTGATTGSGVGTIATPSRLASGAFASHNSPGACGPNNYGLGVRGTTTWQMVSGDRPGGMTPFGYGSGGAVGTSGCHIHPSGSPGGLCVFPGNGRAGVVMLDVLY